jgi:CopG-like RHH_1 or ribbon-helix-helix domain, RHH_5
MGTATKPTGARIQTWLPADLAHELKEHAERERRSVSSVIRNAVEDAVVGVPRRRPSPGSTTAGGGAAMTSEQIEALRERGFVVVSTLNGLKFSRDGEVLTEPEALKLLEREGRHE